MSFADEVEKLAALRNKGVITPEEFEQSKAALLARELDRPEPRREREWTQDPIAPMPESNMIWAVLATLFCAWPLGIVAIVKASRVANLWYNGNYGAARDAAESAKKWSIASAAVGVFLIIILLILAASTGGRIWRDLF